MNLSNRVYWLGLCVELAAEKHSLFEAKDRVKQAFACLQWTRGVDYLLIAKPDATNHLGIRSDCAFCLVLDAGW